MFVYFLIAVQRRPRSCIYWSARSIVCYKARVFVNFICAGLWLAIYFTLFYWNWICLCICPYVSFVRSIPNPSHSVFVLQFWKVTSQRIWGQLELSHRQSSGALSLLLRCVYMHT
jgi:hypothetical protein